MYLAALGCITLEVDPKCSRAIRHLSYITRPVKHKTLQVYFTLWSGSQHPAQLFTTTDGLHVQNLSNNLNGGQPWTVESKRQFLLCAALLTAVLIAFTCARAFLFAFSGLTSAKGFHEKLVNSILNADFSLLAQVPHGCMYASLSSDTETIDDRLPFIGNVLLASTSGFCSALAVMVFGQPTLLVLLALVTILCLRVQATYR
jgi:hypothetical protein